MLLLIPLGFVWRFVPIGLPYLIVKYGGSFLWASRLLVHRYFHAPEPFTLALISTRRHGRHRIPQAGSIATLENIRIPSSA